MRIRRTFTLAIVLAALAVTTAFAQTATAQGSKTTGPTLIKDTENPARSAVHAACEVLWPAGGGAGVRTCDLMTAPAGERLAIEFATAICSVPAGTGIFRTATIETTLADSNPTVLNSRLLLTREESEPS
jgi:hypothetical protein